MNEVVLTSGSIQVQILVSPADERVGIRFLAFFTANICNVNTRRAYGYGYRKGSRSRIEFQPSVIVRYARRWVKSA